MKYHNPLLTTQSQLAISEDKRFGWRFIRHGSQFNSTISHEIQLQNYIRQVFSLLEEKQCTFFQLESISLFAFDLFQLDIRFNFLPIFKF